MVTFFPTRRRRWWADLGFAASANFGDDFALFEPVHGCAPDIAGKGIANPLSMLFTAKMMLEWLGSKRQDPNCIAGAIFLESAISAVTRSGIKTLDIGGNSSTEVVTKAVCAGDSEGKSTIRPAMEVMGMMKEDVVVKW